MGAAGSIGVGTTVAEATVAKAAAFAANFAKNTNNASLNAASYAGLKFVLKATEAANEVIESLQATGKLPANYVNKMNAYASGWSEGKAVNNYVPGGQIGAIYSEIAMNYCHQHRDAYGLKQI